MNGQTDGWVNGWMGEWVNEWQSVHLYIYLPPPTLTICHLVLLFNCFTEKDDGKPWRKGPFPKCYSFITQAHSVSLILCTRREAIEELAKYASALKKLCPMSWLLTSWDPLKNVIESVDLSWEIYTHIHTHTQVKHGSISRTSEIPGHSLKAPGLVRKRNTLIDNFNIFC